MAKPRNVFLNTFPESLKDYRNILKEKAKDVSINRLPDIIDNTNVP